MYLQEPPRGDGASSSVNFLPLLLLLLLLLRKTTLLTLHKGDTYTDTENKKKCTRR